MFTDRAMYFQFVSLHKVGELVMYYFSLIPEEETLDFDTKSRENIQTKIQES